LVLEVPPVLDMIAWRLPFVFLWVCIVTLCFCLFWPISFKNPSICKPLHRNLP
jgi:uncharacterized protein YybS (DUF2232 family)